MSHSSVFVSVTDAQEIINLARERCEAKHKADVEEHLNRVILRHQNSPSAYLFRFWYTPLTRDEAMAIVKEERSWDCPYPGWMRRLDALQESLDTHLALVPTQQVFELWDSTIKFLAPAIKAWRAAKVEAEDKAKAAIERLKVDVQPWTNWQEKSDSKKWVQVMSVSESTLPGAEEGLVTFWNNASMCATPVTMTRAEFLDKFEARK